MCLDQNAEVKEKLTNALKALKSKHSKLIDENIKNIKKFNKLRNALAFEVKKDGILRSAQKIRELGSLSSLKAHQLKR